MKKKSLFLLLIIVMFFSIGCGTKKPDVEVNIFDIDEALKVSDSYMENLALGKSDEAQKLTDSNIKNNNEFEKLKKNEIYGYVKKDVAEATDHAYINYKVIRGDKDGLRSDLDLISVRVKKKDDNYIIDEVKAKNSKQVYVEKNSLRIRDEESGKSEVLIRLKDLPREVYPKKKDVVLGKETVPDGDFNEVSMGFDGNKAAMSTTDGSKTFIAIAMVEDTKQTAGNVQEGDNTNSDEDVDKAIDDALEKPIADKVIGYDIIGDSKIEKLLFSSDDGELLVQVKQGDKGSKIKIYKNPTGELYKLDLESKFPNDKYSCNITRITKDGVFIDVSALTDEKGEEGQYKLDLKAIEINKL